jgi:hypothetical protein
VVDGEVGGLFPWRKEIRRRRLIRRGMLCLVSSESLSLSDESELAEEDESFDLRNTFVKDIE